MSRIISLCLVCLLGVISLLHIGCNPKVDNNDTIETIYINLDNENGKPSRIVIEKIVKLETEQSLVGQLNCLQAYKDKFYILDKRITKSLYAFDLNGQLISKTIVGRGPNEIIHPFAFAIDRINDLVLVYDVRQRSIVTMDLNLNKISEKKIPDLVSVNDMRYIGNDSMLVRFSDEISNSEFTVYGNGFSEATTLDIINFDSIPTTTPSPFSSGDELLFIAPWDNTIYQLKSGSLVKRYYLDFGKYNFTDEEYEFRQLDERKADVRTGKRVGPNATLEKTDKFLMTSFYYKDTRLTYFYSLATGINYNLNDAVHNNIIPYGLTWGALDSDTFFATVYPADMKKFIDANPSYEYLNVSESDNSYIVIYSITE